VLCEPNYISTSLPAAAYRLHTTATREYIFRYTYCSRRLYSFLVHAFRSIRRPSSIRLHTLVQPHKPFGFLSRPPFEVSQQTSTRTSKKQRRYLIRTLRNLLGRKRQQSAQAYTQSADTEALEGCTPGLSCRHITRSNVLQSGGHSWRQTVSANIAEQEEL
jgi:hypothetical protein